MIRLLLFFIALALLAYGGVWLVQHPGHVDLDWFGYRIQTSAALLILAVAVAAIVLYVIVRVVLGTPGFLAGAARRRRRDKGYDALSRGLLAVGSGDARTATRAAAKARRQLGDDPLAMMLEAQAAHLSGDGAVAVRAYGELAQRDDARLLGLRGLHEEASRRGDDEAARQIAAAAHKHGALPWSSRALLDTHAGRGDWEQSLTTVETAVAAGHLERANGERLRAVLETAIARDKELTAPEQALTMAQAAMKRAPDLAPPVVVAAGVLSRRGDIRKAAKLIEKAWQSCQHPDVADAYLDVRPGDSTGDRLARARTLMGIRSGDPVSRTAYARAALAAKDFAAARDAMAPLTGEGRRPTVSQCLLMAEIEEAEHGDVGLQREWLSRASRAALDPAWVADGTVYERWEPASPTTGKLDSFRWQQPAERLGTVMEALPERRSREPALAAPATAATLIGHGRAPAPSEPDVDASAAAELATTPPPAKPTPSSPMTPSPALASPTMAPAVATPPAVPTAVPAEPVAAPVPPVAEDGGEVPSSVMPAAVMPAAVVPASVVPAEEAVPDPAARRARSYQSG